MDNEKPKLAWAEDDNSLLEDNVYLLADPAVMSTALEIEVFRKTFNPADSRNNGHLDLRLAQENLARIPYDLIILDDMMPKTGVYENEKAEAGELLLGVARSNPANRNTLVMMYTESKDPLSVKRYKQLGANLWVPKGKKFLYEDSVTIKLLNSPLPSKWGLAAAVLKDFARMRKIDAKVSLHK